MAHCGVSQVDCCDNNMITAEDRNGVTLLPQLNVNQLAGFGGSPEVNLSSIGDGHVTMNNGMMEQAQVGNLGSIQEAETMTPAEKPRSAEPITTFVHFCIEVTNAQLEEILNEPPKIVKAEPESLASTSTLPITSPFSADSVPAAAACQLNVDLIQEAVDEEERKENARNKKKARISSTQDAEKIFLYKKDENAPTVNETERRSIRKAKKSRNDRCSTTKRFMTFVAWTKELTSVIGNLRKGSQVDAEKIRQLEERNAKLENDKSLLLSLVIHGMNSNQSIAQYPLHPDENMSK